jgi:hypothetical protein
LNKKEIVEMYPDIYKKVKANVMYDTLSTLPKQIVADNAAVYARFAAHKEIKKIKRQSK